MVFPVASAVSAQSISSSASRHSLSLRALLGQLAASQPCGSHSKWNRGENTCPFPDGTHFFSVMLECHFVYGSENISSFSVSPMYF